MTKNTSFKDYNVLKGGFIIVIYVDVLFVINFFFTFVLLLISAKISKREIKLFRFVLASAFGGLYSLVILLDGVGQILSLCSKMLSALLIVLIAFKFYRLSSLIKTFLVFLFSSLITLGVVFGISLILKTPAVTVKNSSLYLDISAKGLVLSGILAYILSSLIIRLYNRSLSKGEIYTIIIESNGKSASLFAFSDTGNKLREPFSDYPVIVAKKEALEDMVTDTAIRLIPASTVNSESFLVSFKPDRITVKTDKGSEVIENVYIALSDDLKNENFSAVFNPEILIA